MKRKKKDWDFIHRLKYRADKVMSVKMLCSYLLILFAPLLAILFTYNQAKDALMGIQYENAGSLMRESFVTMDRRMTEVHNNALYLLNSKRVGTFTKGYKSSIQEFWDKYSFSQEQANYSLINELIDGAYILIEDSDYIVRIPMVVPSSDLGFVSVNQFAVSSYQELMERLCDSNYYGQIICLNDADGVGSIAMVHSLSRSKDRKRGVVLTTLNDNIMSENLAAACPDAKSIGMIISNEDFRVMFAVTGAGEEHKEFMPVIDEINLSEFSVDLMSGKLLKDGMTEDVHVNGVKKPFRTLKINGRKYLICIGHSAIQNWTYVTLTPLTSLLEEIHGVKMTMMTFAALSVLLSLGLCIKLWTGKRKVISQYYALRMDLKAQNMREGGRGSATDFWSGIRDVFDHISDLLTSFSLQKNLAQTTVLKKILYGEYAYQADLAEDLKKTEIDLGAEMCYCLCWSFRGIEEMASFRSITEFRSFIRDFLKERIHENYYLYELSSDRIVLLFCDSGIPGLFELQNRFMKFSAELKETLHLDSYIGVSEPADGYFSIHKAFLLARDACDYASYYQLSMPVKGEDIPPLSSDMFLPESMEQALCTAVLSGNENDFLNIMEKIRENIEKKKPGQAVLTHYLNFVRNAILKTLAPFCTGEKMFSPISRIAIAADWDELIRLTTEAKNMIRAEAMARTDNQPEEQIEIIRRYMEENFCNPDFSIVMLADHLNVSENKIYKDFKVFFGKTFAEYLEGMRIALACELLSKQMPVKEVARMSGYASDPSFRRAFKRVVGMTPTEYLS